MYSGPNLQHCTHDGPLNESSKIAEGNQACVAVSTRRSEDDFVAVQVCNRPAQYSTERLRMIELWERNKCYLFNLAKNVLGNIKIYVSSMRLCSFYPFRLWMQGFFWLFCYNFRMWCVEEGGFIRPEGRVQPRSLSHKIIRCSIPLLFIGVVHWCEEPRKQEEHSHWHIAIAAKLARDLVQTWVRSFVMKQDHPQR